ncbi:MAG: hypothetical protein HEQ16_05015 [Bosea sp.]|jgi:hypothetical protein|nr:hypothetical protein [Bosea sp. (in: a-proteobacteria)]
MSRVLDLLNAVADMLAGLPGPEGMLFADVRVELDRYELKDLLEESTRTPAARVCYLRGAPKRQTSGRLDRDVSVAVILIARRTGRATPALSSADAAVLDLMEQVTGAIAADPYMGLGRISAAEIGDELVAVSDATSKKAMAIGLVEAKWCLLDVHAGQPEAAMSAGVIVDPRPVSITVGGETLPPEDAP